MQGLDKLPYGYAIEARSRTTKSRTHLHGFFIAEDSLMATGFKVAAEKALRHLNGRLVGKASDVDVERAYDVDRGTAAAGAAG